MSAHFVQRRALAAQARSLYRSGASLEAARLLAALEGEPAGDGDRAEALLLDAEIRADRMELDNDAERALLERARALPFAAARLRARLAHYRGDRDAFAAACAESTALLQPLAYTPDLDAAIAFSRFSIDAARGWLDFGDVRNAVEAVRAVEPLAQIRDDVPPELRAELHAQRARAHLAGEPPFARWRDEHGAATTLALEHALVRTAWFCRYLEIAVALAQEGGAGCAGAADAFAASVEASESVAWRHAARHLVERVAGSHEPVAGDLPFEIRSRLELLDTIVQTLPHAIVSPGTPKPAVTLTLRQREIAELAARGASNREIAQRLGLSPRTVENHLNVVFARFEIRSRWQLAEHLAAAGDGG